MSDKIDILCKIVNEILRHKDLSVRKEVSETMYFVDEDGSFELIEVNGVDEPQIHIRAKRNGDWIKPEDDIRAICANDFSDYLRTAIILSHEYGHYRSFIKKERTEFYQKALGQFSWRCNGKSRWIYVSCDDETAIMEEESRAWRYGADLWRSLCLPNEEDLSAAEKAGLERYQEKFAEIRTQRVRFTIDTNLINIKAKLPYMNTLESWYQQGKIELLGTERLRREVERHPNPQAAIKERLIPNISEPMVFGTGSRFGHSKFYSPRPSGATFLRLAEILFPGKPQEKLTKNQQNDVMHLLSHASAEADVFLTDNVNDFVTNGRQNELKEKYWIVVLTPKEAVTELVRRYGWETT